MKFDEAPVGAEHAATTDPMTTILEEVYLDHPLRAVGPRDDISHAGLTVWFTGLSGAGKTTICRAVEVELLRQGHRAEVLDADLVRKQLWPNLGFSKSDRDENIRRMGFLAQMLTRNGVVTLVAAISPYRAVRNEVRGRIARFLEVHVDAPLDVCEQRDPKGLYKRVRAGCLHGFTGIDDPYEAPIAPEVRCATDINTVEACRDQVVFSVLNYLYKPPVETSEIVIG